MRKGGRKGQGRWRGGGREEGERERERKGGRNESGGSKKRREGRKEIIHFFMLLVTINLMHTAISRSCLLLITSLTIFSCSVGCLLLPLESELHVEEIFVLAQQIIKGCLLND